MEQRPARPRRSLTSPHPTLMPPSAVLRACTVHARAALLALPGVGPWTAGYVALRVTGDPDELLATDLAVRRGAAALGLPSDDGDLTARAQPWRPWRSYAAAHLWRVAAAPTEEVPA